MIRHHSPTDLLERFCRVFNKQVTRTAAKESYLAKIAELRVILMKKFGGPSHYDPKTDSFTREITAKLVADTLKEPKGSMSRYHVIAC